jgi:hypothetical protein
MYLVLLASNFCTVRATHVDGGYRPAERAP